MERPDPDSRQPSDFDRVFAEMTADWRPETVDDPASAPSPAPPPRSAWAEDHPLFRHVEEPVAEDDDEEEDPGHFDRPEVTPIRWRELSGVSVVGALLLASTVVVLLLVLFGARFPTAVGYGAVTAFVVGFVLLMTRLRRQGDDEPGGGARL